MEFNRLPTIFRLHPEVKPVFRKYEKELNRLHRLKNQKHFLEECRKEQVLPKMYGFRRWTLQSDPFPLSHKIFLEERIDNTKNEIFLLRRLIHGTQSNLRLLTSDHTYRYLVSFCSDIAAYNSVTHSNILSRKLNNLIDNSAWNNLEQENKVMNLSTTPLTINQHLVLNLGLSFALMPDRKNNLDFIVAFDRFIAGRNYSREEICLKGILLNALTDLNQKYPVPRRFMKAIHSLQKLDVVISRSDKDGKIVIMDKDFYLNKINQLLSDTNTYDKLTKNPLQNVPTEFFRKVRSIGKDKKSIELLEKFKVINPKLPYFYGLPKTHKDNLPFRAFWKILRLYTYILPLCNLHFILCLS